MLHKILCIEASTDICSVGLFGNHELIALKETKISNSHAEILAVLIDDLMKENATDFKELSAVAVSIGPGSYTSLRVGLSTAKGICFAASIPLIALPSDRILLNGQTMEAKQKGCTCMIALIDARRMEAYATVYDMVVLSFSQCTPTLLDENPFAEQEKNHKLTGLCGNGANKYYQICDKNKYVLLTENASASHMGNMAFDRFQAGLFDDTAYTIPVYIKPPNITETKKKLW